MACEMAQPETTALDREGRREFLSRRSEGFAELLAFEAASTDLFEARLPVSGVPYWSIVRFTVARLIGDALFGTRTVQPPRSSARMSATAKFLGRCLLSHPWRAQRARSRILMFSSAIGNSRRPNGYFNRLSDYFAELFADRTTLLEVAHGQRYFFPRTFANTYCFAGAQVVARVAARFAPPSPADEACIQRFLDLLRAQFGQWLGDDSWQYLRAVLLGHVSSDGGMWRLYGSLLDRLCPRLLMVEDGCYGHWGSLILCARQRGVHVAEYQHGLVSRNHEAYNYLPDVHVKVRNVLPDTFLAYGQYWKGQISIPSEVRVVGNPHLTESLRTSPPSRLRRAPACLMLVAGGLDAAIYQRIVLEFLNVAPSHWRVVLRPHPSRRATVECDYPLIAECAQARIDMSDDYYASLREIDVVAGDASTAVMEAAAFDKRVLLIDHIEVRRNYPGMFGTFTSGAELLALIGEPGPLADLPDVDGIWAGDWQAAYGSFVEGILRHGETQ